MEQSRLKVCAASPAEFQPKEIDDFVAFVLAGGEVTGAGLRDRALRAPCISYLRNNECLLGVAGLKSLDPDYRARVEKKSKTKLDKKEFSIRARMGVHSPECSR